MPFLIFAFAAFLGVCFWLVNGWLAGHALVVAVGDKWEIAAQGWGLFLSLGGPLVAFGLLIGLAVGVPAGSRLLGLLVEKQGEEIDEKREALTAERHRIEAIKAKLDGEILKAAMEGRKEGAGLAAAAQQARFAAEDKVNGLERRQKALEGRLKGAQQKAARLKKKAQLKSPSGAKPAAGLVR